MQQALQIQAKDYKVSNIVPKVSDAACVTGTVVTTLTSIEATTRTWITMSDLHTCLRYDLDDYVFTQSQAWELEENMHKVVKQNA